MKLEEIEIGKVYKILDCTFSCAKVVGIGADQIVGEYFHVGGLFTIPTSKLTVPVENIQVGQTVYYQISQFERIGKVIAKDDSVYFCEFRSKNYLIDKKIEKFRSEYFVSEITDPKVLAKFEPPLEKKRSLFQKIFGIRR